ncbi:VWA domain-containing protein [Candidatus Woesearchaeota archaeon]|nr:VWA domain-containing protein [Candidatus Woesearchaeota archaeon]
MGLGRLIIRNRKGFMFTFDAVLAAMLLIGGLLIISHHLISEHPKENIEFITMDLLSSLSELNMSEIDSSFVSTNLSSSYTNMNLSVLEQIGTYWAAGEVDKARILSSFTLDDILPQGMSFNLSMQGNVSAAEHVLFNQSQLNISNLVVGQRMITGIVNGSPLQGFSSLAYLRRIDDKRTSSLVYFGGFIGQGNLSAFVDDIPDDVTSDQIYLIDMEMDAGSDFSLYINENHCGDFIPSGTNMSPDYWNITSCKTFVTSGRNDFKIIFHGAINESYIAGGFIKINYKTEEQLQDLSIGEKIDYFPGVIGVANLYDSFYIPGTLTNMTVHLHFNSAAKTYLSVGDVIVYQNQSSGETTVTLADAELTNFPINLNYNDLSNKTIPLRFASYNETYIEVFGTNADVVLITDLSGSMKYRMDSWSNPGNAIPGCKEEDITDPDSRRLGVAACLDSEVNAIIMNDSVAGNTNRLWLVDFSDDANPFFSSNLALLTETNIENEIDDRYKSKSQQEIKGGTCLCCAINQAYEIINTYSGVNRTKSVIVMTDGVPTYCCGGYWAGILDWRCNETGTSTNSAWPDWWQVTGCTGDEADCSGTDCDGPINSAINAAQRLHDDLNVTVYGIGFGPLETCVNANYTISHIAEAGNGSFVVGSNATILRDFYRNVSNEIVSETTQSAQIVTVEGNLTPSILYNDSYIEFTYNPIIVPPEPNEISLVLQTEQFGSCTPNIEIPDGIRVMDAKIVSYSDYHWSDTLVVDGTTVFNLSSFSSDYTRLGDPYPIQIPVNLLSNGTHALIVETGDSPVNRTGCSNNNSMIYTVLVPSSTARSGVVESTGGCIWTIQFEDDSYSVKTIPEDYTGTDACNYTDSSHTLEYETDAYDVAVFNLLRTLDFDDNGKIFVNLDATDIEIVITTISSVPYLWGPTIVKAKVWQ